MQMIRNAWSAVARSDELGERPLGRTLFGEAMVLFRTADGTPVALGAVCPHKSAPLDLGAITNNRIACPYHGLEFDPAGRCVHIPGQEHIPASLRVASWPCIEALGLVWAWPGDPARIGATRPPELAQFGAPGWTYFHGQTSLFPAAIDRVLDNLADPAHTSFVHARTIGGADAAGIPLDVSETPDSITISRWIENSRPVPVMATYGNFSGTVDRWQVYHLRLPNISVVDFGAIPTAAPRDEATRDRYYRTYSFAALTPADAHSTHYFWLVLRNFADGNVEVSAQMQEAYLATFAEDIELLARIEAVRGREHAPAENLLGIDGGTIRLRRALAARRAAEQHD